MWFGYYPEIIFCHFFRNLNLVIFRRFYYQSEKIVGTLCAQLLLQFYIDSFETSQVFCTWSEDMHVVWIYSSDYFLTLFPPVELSHFSDIFTTIMAGDINSLNLLVLPGGCNRTQNLRFGPYTICFHFTVKLSHNGEYCPVGPLKSLIPQGPKEFRHSKNFAVLFPILSV